MEASLDFMSSVIDEIALEGLDGITVTALWTRLENRPSFPLSVDDNSKTFLWECIALHKELEFHQLPKARKPLKIFPKFVHDEDQIGLIVEPKSLPPNVYSFNAVEDGNVKGSCATYSLRTCVTNQVRHDTVLLVSLKQALTKWGDSLVLVASSKLRLLSLIGTESNPSTSLTKDMYCILEQIGRSRFQGELSAGELSLQAMLRVDNLNYYLEKLVSRGMITKQRIFLKRRDGKNTTGHLYHLIRYYVQIKTKFETVMECICNILKAKPNRCEEYKILMHQLGFQENTFKKLFQKNYQKWYKTFSVPYRSLHPDATKKTYLLKNGQEKQVRVVKMVLPYDLEVEATCEEQDEKCLLAHFDSSKFLYNRSGLQQVYDLIESAGPSGISMVGIRNTLTLPRLDVRHMCRNLDKRKMVFKLMVDKGRQRSEMFISTKFDPKRLSHKKITAGTSLSDPVSVPEDTNVQIGILKEKVTDDNNISQANVTIEEPCATDIQKAENLSKENKPIIIEQVQNACSSGINETVQSGVSQRTLQRANLILEYLKHESVASIFQLTRFLAIEEKKEGYNFIVDRRTVKRLCAKLHTDKQVTAHRTVLKAPDKSKTIELVCDLSVQSDGALLKRAIAEHSFKFIGTGKLQKKRDKQESDDFEVPTKKLKMDIPISKKKFYGVMPKFTRAKTLHLFLCYLVRHYEGTAEEQEESFVYLNEVSWKRFVPPLPENVTGWCVVSDILTRMPLSIFVKVIIVRNQSEELDAFLSDKEKRNLLVKHLPESLKTHLLGNLSLCCAKLREVVKLLCYMGLVSFGPKMRFEQYRDYVYVHKCAQIKDTTIAPHGYMKIDDTILYESKAYCFETMNDVESYWLSLEAICLWTPLGKYSVANGQSVTILEPSMKWELQNCVTSKEIGKVDDVGDTPGDGLGAAGLDTSLFAHLRRNWFLPDLGPKLSTAENEQKCFETGDSHTIQHLLKRSVSKSGQPESRKRLQRLNKRILVPLTKKTNVNNNEALIDTDVPNTLVKVQKLTKSKRGPRTRLVKRNSSKQRQPYYDDKDRAAIKFMDKLRCEWVAEEDSFLLLCKVASVFLDPKNKGLVVPFFVVRDQMHEKLPHISFNKTSRACQRRLRRILLTNQETRNSVAVFLSEAKLDTELVREFDIPKPPRTQEERWKELFIAVLEKLTNKFTMCPVARYKPVALPDTVDALNSSYNIIVPSNCVAEEVHWREPETSVDVDDISISLFFISSLETVVDQTNWSYILYRVYEQYPDNLLKSIIDKYKHRLLITKKMKFKTLSKMMVSSLPYRFTVSYDNFFLSKCPLTIHADVKDLLTKLCAHSEVNLESHSPAGYAATILSLALMKCIQFCVNIPDPVIVVNTTCLTDIQRSILLENIKSSMSDQDSSELLRLLDSDNSSNLNTATELGPRVKRRKKDKSSDSFNLSKNKNALNKSSAVIECSSESVPYSSSRLALHLLRQESSLPNFDKNQIPHDCVFMNHCDIQCSMKFDAAASQCTMRLTPQEVADKTVANMTSYEAQHEKILDVETINGVIAEQCFYIPEEALQLDDYQDSIRIAYNDYAGLPTVVEEAKLVFTAILNSGDLGTSQIDLWTQFCKLNGVLSLFEHLSVLRKSNLVIRVGVVGFRYVCITKSRAWLLSSIVVPKKVQENSVWEEKSKISLESHEVIARNNLGNGFHSSGDDIVIKTEIDYEQQQSEEDKLSENKRLKNPSWGTVLFLPKIWRKPDGALNGPVFVKYLQTVLRHTLCIPGATEESICSHFSLLIPPVQTLELLEVLEKTHCIFKYHCKPLRKSTLFSPASHSVITSEPEPNDIVHYETLADALVKMAQLTNAIM